MTASRVIVHNKKTPIFEMFLAENGELESLGEILNMDLMPICLQNEYTIERVAKWMNSRSVPKTRDGLGKVLKQFGDIDARHGMFSLSDQYWVQWNDNESWEKGNFFRRHYQTDYGRMFFSPWSVRKNNIRQESPDRTTNGVLRKRWVQPDENDPTSYLIKAGSRAAHQEPISEVLSSMTLSMLDIIPYVEYEFVIDGLQLCSRCRNFICEDTEFVPASHVYWAVLQKDGETPFMHMIRACEAFGVMDAEDYLLRMIAADYLLCNNDRHLGNFGFIRSAETGKILSFAPLFDSGSAFFGNANKDGQKSRLFSGMEEKSLSYTIKKCDLSQKFRYKDLTDVIEMYPLLSGAEKKRINEQVACVYDRLNRMIKAENDRRGI